MIINLVAGGGVEKVDKVVNIPNIESIVIPEDWYRVASKSRNYEPREFIENTSMDLAVKGLPEVLGNITVSGRNQTKKSISTRLLYNLGNQDVAAKINNNLNTIKEIPYDFTTLYDTAIDAGFTDPINVSGEVYITGVGTTGNPNIVYRFPAEDVVKFPTKYRGTLSRTGITEAVITPLTKEKATSFGAQTIYAPQVPGAIQPGIGLVLNSISARFDNLN